MKKIFISLLFLITVGLFAENVIVLYPGLSYRNNDEEVTYKGKHIFGDNLETTGEEIKKNKATYLSVKVEDGVYYSYAPYMARNSREGVITKDSFIYSSDDLSSITENTISTLTFVAVSQDEVSDKFYKIKYITPKGDDWVVRTGWVKKQSVSTTPDNWASAIKYFLATLDEKPELQMKRLETIKKLHKNSIFMDSFNSMIENKNLVIKKELVLDENFKGTLSFTNPINGKIYKSPDEASEVVFEGEFSYSLQKKIKGKNWFYVSSSQGDGWILK